MFGKRLTLIRLLGFEIRADLTWLILVALIVWVLTAGYFPAAYQDLPTIMYFWMAVVGAIGLFASIVVHELSHSVVARRLGLEIHGITLFVFGGAAEMTEEPPSPRAEFLIAIAGPAASVVLAVAFLVLGSLLQAIGLPGPLVGVVGYLAGINLILAVFNMVPAFPLDGGRVLRAALWAWRRDLRWATRIATSTGGILGLVLILLGLVSVLGGNLLAGMWWFLIGLFIRAAAAQAYQQLLNRQILQGVPVRRFMNPNPIAVAPDVKVADLVENFFLGRYLKLVPVVEEGRLVGAVGVRQVKELSPEQRQTASVRDILSPVGPDGAIPPDADAAEALALMQRTGASRLLVAEGDRLVGILSLRDLMRYLSLRVDLDGGLEDRGRTAAPPMPR